ncbi:hypothetical protein H4582DRAFT_2119766 [Lactarius indigo]|nr:hypothetical protein H4582DRAFT_2119766 [Lactarius indigo]
MAATRHVSDKPLPATPAHKPTSKTLTIESSNHLRQFLSHTLEEETGYRDADKDAWVTDIEDALNNVARAVNEGMWLSGIRRTRAARREREERAAAEDTKREQEHVAKEKETEARNRAKHRPSSAADTAKQIKEADAVAAEAKTEAPRSLKPPSEDANRNLRALQQLRNLANRRPPSSSGDPDLERARHFLLTVAGPDLPTPRPFASVTAGDSTVPRCTFSPGVYSLPPPDLFGEDPDDNNEAVINSALYGFKEWDVNFPKTHDKIELIGGTFKLNRVRSVDEHASLVRVLRVSVYFLLSLLLEQYFLSNSSIELHYPEPSPTPISPPPPPIAHRNSSSEVHIEARQRKRDLFRQGLWSLLHRRLPRAVTINSSEPRDASLDLSHREQDTPTRTSIDTPLGPTQPRQRRFSIFGESHTPPPPPEPSQTSHDKPYQTALQRVEEAKALLSTSPGLVISPPKLLMRLAELEKANPTRRLTGDERSGLTSILGWEGKKAALRGSMTGTVGFLRQQQLSLLYSEYVYDPDLASQSSANGSPIKFVDAELKPHTHSGARVRWVTYMYYGDCDQSLGDTITSMCSRAEEPCSQPACKALQGRHMRSWTHGGICVTAKTEPQVPFASPDVRSREMEMWQSCKVCQESTARCNMSDGTYLFSFAKFLELLLYSPTMCTLSHTLCTHTSPSPDSSSLPASRFNIIRHFSHKSHRVSFTISPIDDVFDLLMPRLQFTKGGWVERSPQATAPNPAADDADKKELRQEIKYWWQAVAEHLDKVEAEFTGGDASYRKSLPRLPSSDDAWENPSEERLTPKGLPASLPPTPTHSAQPSLSSLATITPTHPGSDPSSDATVPSDDPIAMESPIHLLMNMRFAFHRAEQALYSQLRETPNAVLNNTRREFHSAAHGASRRLAAWETKHMSKDARQRLAADREAIQKPQWWHSGYHAVPGGNVIVQEEDWGSIIAFTLSSLDYQRELAYMSNPRAAQTTPAPPPSRSAGSRQTTVTTLGRSSASASTSSFKFFGSSHKPDPDREDSVWHEPEACSAVVSRKEHPRDPTALLSLREVLRHKVPVDGGVGTPSSVFPSVSRMANNGAPPLAWAKPAVEVNVAAVDGQVTGMPEAVVTAGRILHELDAASVVSSKTSNSSFVETNVHRGKTSSVLSHHTLRGDGTGTVGPTHQGIHSPTPLRATTEGGVHALVDSRSRTSTASTTQDATEASTHDNSAFSWTSSLTNAMRYMLKAEFPAQPSPMPKNHHGLLSTDPLTIDERPHIKYDWTIGKRLKFSCTVYYAKQFDALRRRCGVEEVFTKSMAKCENWKAEGGKSRSNFWQTSDSRFIVKTLVNAWNVADLQVLIDLAPSYFLHMETTASRASILAKLLGFYTVEVRNLEAGTVQAKADLLVMENLFYGQKPTRTFDLKGIQGRKVKANSSSSMSKTLFDSEWIEGQQRALTLVNPVSKVILQEAVRADCDFLSNSNIMDYSLLLGVYGERKQIHCGLVDTIGSYTFAKTLEYKAKGLSGKDGKDITVIPPHEYKERFVSALDGYFMACPGTWDNALTITGLIDRFVSDKWTKPPDEKKLIHDPALLPSVL